jgi:hypothetical protein
MGLHTKTVSHNVTLTLTLIGSSVESSTQEISVKRELENWMRTLSLRIGIVSSKVLRELLKKN